MAWLKSISMFLVLMLSAISMTIGSGETSSYCGGSPKACCERFGINEYTNPRITVTASSFYSDLHAPTRAKLNEISNKGSPNGGNAGWSARSNNAQQWIQVDFGIPRRVTGVLLQGRGYDFNQWVTSFRVMFSNDGDDFYSTATIDGSVDRETVERRFFDKAVVARYIRIRPLTWHDHISLRFDLLGCSAQITPS